MPEQKAQIERAEPGSTEAARERRAQDPKRVLTLSDGVFAVILTLLVLEIKVPTLGKGQSLVDALRDIRPSFIAFFISFVVVAIAWSGHRDQFRNIRSTDGPLIWLNFLYMFPLSILPFGASLLARYDQDSVALRLYGLILVTITTTHLVMWLYSSSQPQLLFCPVETRSRIIGAVFLIIPGVAYMIGVSLADWSPQGSLLIYAFVPVLYFVEIPLRRLAEQGRSPS